MVRLESEDFIGGVRQIIAKDCKDEDANIVLVWLSKTIQNWKGMFYCFSNKKYYEATFNGDKDELYLDCYKIDHKRIFKVEESEPDKVCEEDKKNEKIKYKCIKGFSVDKCDDNGFLIENEYKNIEIGSVWETDDTANMMTGGLEHVRLENIKDGSWLEIHKGQIDKYFKQIKPLNDNGLTPLKQHR